MIQRCRPADAYSLEGSTNVRKTADGLVSQAGAVRWFLGDLAPSDTVEPSAIIWGSELLSAADKVADE